MRNRISASILATLLAVLGVAACDSSGSSSRGGGKDDTVTLVTHDSFAVSKRVLRDFTKRTGITVKVLKNGDAGAALNQAILTKDAPLGDAFFGVDNTFLSPRSPPASSCRTRPRASTRCPRRCASMTRTG